MQKIINILGNYSKTLETNLNDLAKNNYYLFENKLINHIDHISFEIFDDYGVCMYPMDKNLNQVGFFSILNLGDENLLSELVNEENLDEIEKIFISWFISIFEESNLKNSKIQFYINIHDSINQYNFNKKIWELID